jgi:hypothetical protein
MKKNNPNVNTLSSSYSLSQYQLDMLDRVVDEFGFRNRTQCAEKIMEDLFQQLEILTPHLEELVDRDYDNLTKIVGMSFTKPTITKVKKYEKLFCRNGKCELLRMAMLYFLIQQKVIQAKPPLAIPNAPELATNQVMIDGRILTVKPTIN